MYCSRCRNIFHIVLAVKVYKLDELVVNFSDTDCDSDSNRDSDLDQQLAVGKLSENTIKPVEYSKQSHQCHQNPTIITYPTTIIKSQEEAIQTALNHHLSDNDTNSTFYTDGSKTQKGVGAAYCQIKNVCC